MDGIIDQFAKQLSSKRHDSASMERSLTEDGNPSNLPPAPVLQLNKFPLVLDLNTYKNAQSPTNPAGSLRATYALSQLADSIPLLGRDFAPSPLNLPEVYDGMVFSAQSDTSFTTRLIANAQRTMETSNFSGMGGIVNDWYPVYTIPDNWYDLVENEANLQTIVIDPNDTSTQQIGAFQIIGATQSEDALLLQAEQQEQLDPLLVQKVQKIELQVMRVDFERPWLNFELFRRRDWWIDGVIRRYYSNGKLDNNRGVMPLIISTMLVGVSLKVTGDFTSDEVARINASGADRQINIGPFALKSTGVPLAASNSQSNTLPTQLESNTTQVVGYISDVVPFSPFLPKP